MGEEIKHSHFVSEDFERYKDRLTTETQLLADAFAQDRFAKTHPVAGFELESWLVDHNFCPAPINEAFLNQLNNPLASPELANFNIELNTEPRPLQGYTLSAMHQALDETWVACCVTAEQLDTKIIMCGILPTCSNEDLNLANMSNMKRYRALNREVIHRRKGKPLVLDINGEEHLKVTHRDVMLESAATSFQVHMQVNREQAVRFYNASILLSAPIVALSANSPYFMGKDLWDETRIPLFEQAVAIGGYDGANFGPIHRVSFGTGYAHKSMMECFEENLAHYPVLLPVDLEEPASAFPHLKLHNGTIWRWNRPLISLDDDGLLQFRIEHRVIPAGPTIIDTIANAGVVTSLAQAQVAPEYQLDFAKAKDNFYRAAQLGLRAHIDWIDGQRYPMTTLINDVLLPMAYEGLVRLGIADSDRQDYLEVIEQRVVKKATGAHWQRAYVKKHGHDMFAMTAQYYMQQNSGNPVHDWTV